MKPGLSIFPEGILADALDRAARLAVAHDAAGKPIPGYCYRAAAAAGLALKTWAHAYGLPAPSASW